MIYNCEACKKPISKSQYINGLRLKKEALCMLHQATRNIINGLNTKKDGWADMMNAVLYNKFEISKEQAEKDINLPYFKN